MARRRLPAEKNACWSISGIVEKDVGAPIRSSLDVVRIGETEDRLPVYLDKLASEADHIVLINRIKKHTEFEHEFESGLLKMMAIGLGKQEGAAAYHEAMLTLGYPRVILTVARKMMQSANVLFGVGVVEERIRPNRPNRHLPIR